MEINNTSALDWLVDQIDGFSWPINNNQNIRISIPKEILSEAKEIETLQKMAMYNKGYSDGQDNILTKVGAIHYKEKEFKESKDSDDVS